MLNRRKISDVYTEKVKEYTPEHVNEAGDKSIAIASSETPLDILRNAVFERIRHCHFILSNSRDDSSELFNLITITALLATIKLIEGDIPKAEEYFEKLEEEDMATIKLIGTSNQLMKFLGDDFKFNP